MSIFGGPRLLSKRVNANAAHISAGRWNLPVLERAVPSQHSNVVVGVACAAWHVLRVPSLSKVVDSNESSSCRPMGWKRP